MCGRYFVQLDESEVALKIKKRMEQLSIEDVAINEVFPSQKALVLIPKKQGIDIDVKKWGIEGKSLLINARNETIHEKYTFQRIQKNRCAILANGFYEWKDKQKIYITTNENYMYLAGLYNENNEFVILTGNSEFEMKEIHDRTPLIMNFEEMKDYLKFKIDPIVNNQHLYFQPESK